MLPIPSARCRFRQPHLVTLKMTDALELLTKRLANRDVFNVQINRTTDGTYYVFSNCRYTGNMLEGWGVTIELAIQSAFGLKSDDLEDLLG